MTRRNSEIWEKSHERLEALFSSAHRSYRQASQMVERQTLPTLLRNFADWKWRYDALERRVWHALCVAKGWRKA